MVTALLDWAQDRVATPIWLCHLFLPALGSKLTAGHRVEAPGLPFLDIATRIPAGHGAQIYLLPFFLPSLTCLRSIQLHACLQGPRVELLKAPCRPLLGTQCTGSGAIAAGLTPGGSAGSSGSVL